MTSKDKICKVLKEIKDKSEINPNPKYIEFYFNTHVVEADILSDDEERNILLKLEKDGFIKLYIPEQPGEEGRWSAYTKEELVYEIDKVIVELRYNFNKKYLKYCFSYLIKLRLNNLHDFWIYTSPFWWIWWLMIIIKKHKAVSLIIAILSLLAVDYSLAWKNLNFIISFFKKYVL